MTTDWWHTFSRPVAVQSKRDLIRDTALKRFAEDGVSATSLRDVAEAGKVSIGLIQHHFGSKEALVGAVDEYVLATLSEALAGPVDREFDDPVAQHGYRVMTLITTQPTIADYVGRALVEKRAFGSLVFDGLVAAGQVRWQDRSQQGLTKDDLDLTWAALNPLVLVLGAIVLRTHVDRHLSGPLTSTEEANRWMDAVNTLLRDGLYERQSDIPDD